MRPNDSSAARASDSAPQLNVVPALGVRLEPRSYHPPMTPVEFAEGLAGVDAPRPRRYSYGHAIILEIEFRCPTSVPRRASRTSAPACGQALGSHPRRPPRTRRCRRRYHLGLSDDLRDEVYIRCTRGCDPNKLPFDIVCVLLDVAMDAREDSPPLVCPEVRSARCRPRPAQTRGSGFSESLRYREENAAAAAKGVFIGRIRSSILGRQQFGGFLSGQAI